MAESRGKINAKTLRALLDGRAVDSLCLTGRQGGFALLVRFGATEKLLESRRAGVRLFASLNTATQFLRNLGAFKFEVDSEGYVPGRLRGPRPDRAEALRSTRTHPRQQPLL